MSKVREPELYGHAFSIRAGIYNILERLEKLTPGDQNKAERDELIQRVREKLNNLAGCLGTRKAALCRLNEVARKKLDELLSSSSSARPNKADNGSASAQTAPSSRHQRGKRRHHHK